MTSWRYISPGDDGEPVVTTLSEAQIIAEYFPWWSEQMRKVGKVDQINERTCIEDWVVVHWAEQARSVVAPRDRDPSEGTR